MILSNMTALTYLDLSGLLINKMLVVSDSCGVFCIFFHSLMSVIWNL